MRRSSSIVIVAGFVLIIGSQVLYTILLATPNGIRIRSPEGNVTLDRTFVVSGDAWMRSGISSIHVQLTERSGTGSSSFPAVRDMVRHKGQALFALSSWSARIEVPADGFWDLRASVTGIDGSEKTSAARSVSVREGAPVREFRSWTAEHLVPIGIIAAIAIGLGFFARAGRRRNFGELEVSSRYRPLVLCLAIVVWINEFAYQVYWFLVGGWSVVSALMLQMCGLSILFLPVMLFSEKQKTRQFLFDILYFWGIGGAFMALIAPDIGANGFPAYKYFSFFLSHGLIITSAVVMAIAGGVSLSPRSLLRVFIFTNLFLIPVYGIDQAIALIPPYDPGNYFALGYPPPTGSIVDLFSDLFGSSPRYVIGLELMGIAVFGILYLPWPIARRIKAARAPQMKATDLSA
ncbi:MAG: TIGR02206 family membrane protein [Spirochaetia bacterium]|jgi:hypothetical integral membrane protein (TIGR02206 family)